MASSGKRVLVVEDYQQLRDLMATVLHEVAGHEVETAGDALAARQLLAGAHFDLIVLDIGLPGPVSSREFAQLARAHSRCPILFVTGRAIAELGLIEAIGDCDSFLRKPFRMDALLAEAAKLLRSPAGESAPRTALTSSAGRKSRGAGRRPEVTIKQSSGG
jgi:DNA-binding response OmpR family regulator